MGVSLPSRSTTVWIDLAAEAFWRILSCLNAFGRQAGLMCCWKLSSRRTRARKKPRFFGISF